MNDGSKIVWEDSWLNKTELLHFFNIVLSMVRGDDYYGKNDSQEDACSSDESDTVSPSPGTVCKKQATSINDYSDDEDVI